MGFPHVMPWLSQSDKCIEMVQQGEVELTDGNSSVTDAIVSVTKNKSFMVFTYKGPSDNNPQNVFLMGEITNNTTLTFSRTGTSGNCTIRWFVVTFKATCSASVQHNTTVMASVAQNVAISSVNVTNSFPIISYKCLSTLPGNTDYHSAQLTSPTNLQIGLNTFGANTVNSQVVYHPHWTVSVYTDSAAAGDLQEDTAISSVDLTKVFLIVSGTTPNVYQANEYFRNRVRTPTEIRAQRVASGVAVDFIYHVVEGNDFVSTRQNNTTMPVSTATVVTGGLSHNVNNTVIFMGKIGWSQLATDNGNPNYNNNGVMAWISSGTEFTIERTFGNPSVSGSGDFIIVDFTKGI